MSRIRKPGCRIFVAPSCGISLRKKHLDAIAIHFGIAADGFFEIGNGRGRVAESEFALPAKIESALGVGFRGDSASESRAGLLVVALVPIEFPEFLEIGDRGICPNGRFDGVS